MAEVNSDTAAPTGATEAWSKTWLVPLLLLLVRECSSYGSALMERAATFGVAALNPGTVYRTLRQMEQEGMVRSSWDTSETGPARRLYAITEAGEAYLKYWADSLNHSQQLMETFFRLYTGRPSQKDQS